MNGSGTVIPASANNNAYGFTGRRLDTETGLWYFRARYFSDELGRFISRDPLGYDGGGMSLYNGYFALWGDMDPWGLMPQGFNPSTGMPIGGGNSSNSSSGSKKKKTPYDEAKADEKATVNQDVYDYDKDGNKTNIDMEVSEIIDEIGILDANSLHKKKGHIESARDNCINGVPGAYGGEADALRHCVSSCEMAKIVGETQSVEVGAIHEKWNKAPKGNIPKIYKTHKEFATSDLNMDLNNNRVGAKLGGDKCKDCCKSCNEALKNGKLVVNEKGGYKF